ncbi:2Fe-2S iron-sulfur cluster-binding protein [Zhongshania aliphaticivorans]|uniref:2Fe-2S iron-sulfur cluster-binding protein n=1 Tax=Zhongshania aliphaticivorans TaxID=1470434 RepID=UPI0012E5F760|nr:2Fe-2S iron-sulfur cluster-binding protein [Zhongshania aliphaticivorans]CAA0081468.1 Naphthalene 1,2-dioxygenase system ferredoxin--NAD(P)(+), reductase component [Zhongshania aliphaticivorans]
MPTIRFKELSYSSADDESVLDTLLRHHIAIPYGCRAGACQACTLQATPSQIPDDCQQGLSEHQVRQGYFLACQCTPNHDIDVNTVNTTATKIPATIIDKTLLDENTLRLRLSCRLRWRAGQYITLWMKDVARCYSIASVARLEPYIELHIRVHPRGIISQQLFANTEVDETLELQGPLGGFVYEQEHASQPLLLIGSGTGIAPLIGIARDAIDCKHNANIHLIALDRTAENYAMQQLETLKNSASQFSFQTDVTDNTEVIISKQFSSLRGQRVYICGGQNFVQRIRKKCFMLGASPRHIITEEFINFGSQDSN